MGSPDRKRTCKVLACLGVILVCSSPSAWTQKALNWRIYRALDGLPEAACLSVTVGSHGRILTRHAHQPFISHLDGYDITRIPTPPSNARRVYESPAGQLWMPAHKGLFEFRDGGWVLHPLREVAARFAASPQRPMLMPIKPVRQGYVLFLLQDALMVYNAKDPAVSKAELIQSSRQTSIGELLSFSLARDGGLWVSGANGLAKVAGPARNLKPDAPWQDFIPPENSGLRNFLNPIEHEDGSVTALAELAKTGQKVLAIFDRQRWSIENPGIDKLKFAWRSSSRTYWAATDSSLFHWEAGTDAVESDEISARVYQDVGVERGGTFWLATSDGLHRYAPPVWRTPRAAQRLTGVINCITSDRVDKLWFVSGNALHSLQGEIHNQYLFPSQVARRLPPARAVFALKNGNILIEAGSKLIVFDIQTNTFGLASDAASTFRVLGNWQDGTVCLQRVSASGVQLEKYDGSAFTPFEISPEVERLGTNFLSFFASQSGDLWLGADGGTAIFVESKWRVFPSADQSAPEGATAFIEMPDGKIWCAAQDQIWEYDNRAWRELPRGFDRINSLKRTRDGSVWVASNTGCMRNFQGTWVENGQDEGLPSSAIRDIFEDSRGRIWAATTRGLSAFHPEADPDPPKASIQDFRQSAKDIREGTVVNLHFTAVDKWKFTPRDRLLFSYRLDQREWSDFADITHIAFPDLPAGKHYFQLRAMDRNCNVDPSPDRVEFAIVLPWYKELRVVVAVSIGAGAALFFALLAFNRHRRLFRSHAEVERKVAERTRELEIANRELLHSQKMTALGTLAAGIAHDFNNILSIVKGSAQIIETNLTDTEKIKIRIDRIKTVVEQGSGIVRAMLGFSRDSGQQTGLCDVNAIVEDTVKLLGDRFLREARVVTQPAPSLPLVPGSKDLVQQILLNFIFNASEAMTGKKEIEISTRGLDQLPPGMVLAPAKGQEYVEIAVKDSGCGIAPEVLPRIFEPFFTTKALSARRGTGLGLSMVYELAKKLDAGLSVETVLDQGTIFSLILPVRDLPAVSESATHEPAQNTDHRG